MQSLIINSTNDYPSLINGPVVTAELKLLSDVLFKSPVDVSSALFVAEGVTAF